MKPCILLLFTTIIYSGKHINGNEYHSIELFGLLILYGNNNNFRYVGLFAMMQYGQSHLNTKSDTYSVAFVYGCVWVCVCVCKFRYRLRAIV